MSKELVYKNIEALSPVEQLVEEAGAAVADTRRTIKTSGIPEILGAATGVGAGAAIGLGLLSAGGSVAGLSAAGITSGLAAAGAVVGGGMVAGIAVLAAPAVALGVGGYAVLSHFNHKKLVVHKDMLLQEAVRKHDAIIRALKQEGDANQERLEYLNAINIQLQRAINALKADLAA